MICAVAAAPSSEDQTAISPAPTSTYVAAPDLASFAALACCWVFKSLPAAEIRPARISVNPHTRTPLATTTRPNGFSAAVRNLNSPPRDPFRNQPAAAE